MALSRESLLKAIDYWKIEKSKTVDELEDLIEDGIDDDTPIDKIKYMKTVSKNLDDIELVIRRINQLLINIK